MVLTPTTIGPSFSEKRSKEMDPVQMYLNDLFTVIANVIYSPAIAVPVGLSSDNLPLSMQFIGDRLSEDKLLQIASVFEREVCFDEERKKISSIL